MMQARKLIEVALPIKEISAESVRDKSIRHGHISTLHLWWARRPLPVCRAVVFASLVPDPLDEHCPKAFIDAVNLLLAKDPNTKQDPYKPYDDIPYTAAIDPMEDNPRNRLLMFIGKFSDEFIRKGGKGSAKDQIHIACLIKWENKNDEKILNIARKLIWVAYNATAGKDAQTLLHEFDQAYKAIKQAEHELYSIKDRHIRIEEVTAKEQALEQALEHFLNQMPKVFDPFAGGGAIPLEAARLGCKSYGNDINPVAHIIQKGGLEFPQKFGKPIVYSYDEFKKNYGENSLEKIPFPDRIIEDGEISAILIPNRLSFDVAFYAEKLIKMVEEDVDHLYPRGKNGKKPIAYYWVKVGTCTNPTCQAKVPLLKQFYLSKRRNTKPSDWVHLYPIISGNQISFEIRKGKIEAKGWLNRGNLICPCCGNTTDVDSLKQQFLNKQIEEELIAVIWDAEKGKLFQPPTQEENGISNLLPKILDKPTERMQRNSAGGDTFSWGITKWGDMFSDRQFVVINSFVSKIKELFEQLGGMDNEYNKSIAVYLSILLDRIIARNNTFCRWHTHQDTIEHPFGRQAIPMIFDYPEMNPFGDFSGSAQGQLELILNVITEQGKDLFLATCKNSASGEKSQFPSKYLTSVVTDPPYYDAIAYADISDFFYVWLKRTLGEVYPLNFATPQTPKTNECTALKYHHGGDVNKAYQHFENKMLEIFDAIEHQTSDIVSIMFAHQSTTAWQTLCNSILGARMNITGSWAIDTEMTGRMVAISGSALETSVTVSCRPAQGQGIGEYREVKRAIEQTVKKEVGELYRLGFRGADLLTACFGPAVSEFGKYKMVEKADGTEVTVAELLEMAREAAFNAIVSDIDTDDYTKFYIGWLNLFGFSEAEHDDVRRISQIGLNIDLKELINTKILIQDGKKQSLASFVERVKGTKKLGEAPNSYMIDKLHRAMHLYKAANRGALVQYIGEHANSMEHPFWRVLTSLSEVLPAGAEDHKSAIGLMTNKESLIRESLEAGKGKVQQQKLFE